MARSRNQPVAEVPFGFGAFLARLAVTASIGLGFGLAVAAALRLAGVGMSPATTRKRVPAEVS